MNNRLDFKLKTLEAIDNIFDQMEKLELKRDSLSESFKKSYDQQMAALKMRRSELKSTLEGLEKTSEANWNEAKEVVSESMKHYKAGFEELGKLFK